MVSEGNGGLVTANLLTTIMALACYARLQYCASHVPEQVGTVRHALRLQAVAIALSLVSSVLSHHTSNVLTIPNRSLSPLLPFCPAR